VVSFSSESVSISIFDFNLGKLLACSSDTVRF